MSASLTEMVYPLIDSGLVILYDTRTMTWYQSSGKTFRDTITLIIFSLFRLGSYTCSSVLVSLLGAKKLPM